MSGEIATHEYDLVVAGGGTAGCAAAISAARQGMRVCLIEQAAMLGGNGTSGLVTQIFGPKKHFGGIGMEVIDRLRERGGVGPTVKPGVYWWVPYRNEALKLLWDEMVTESGVDLLLCARLVDVTHNGGNIKALTVSGPEGSFPIRSRIFIDATGDAFLSYLAGEQCLVGDEHGKTQAPSMEAYYANVDFARTEAFIRREGIGYNNVLRKYVAMAVRDGVISADDLHHPGFYQVGENLALLNVGHVYGADCLTTAGLTRATLEARRIANEYFAFYRRYIPGFEKAELVCTGSWLGIRETRRVVGQYLLTYEDKKQCRKFDDTVLRFAGGSKTDMHGSSADPEEHEKFLRRFTEEIAPHAPDDYCTLPYRCLLAGKSNNLMVAGRCISAERETLATLRVMGYCMMMGQVAGTAAASAIRENKEVTGIDISTLQARLREDGIVNI